MWGFCFLFLLSTMFLRSCQVALCTSNPLLLTLEYCKMSYLSIPPLTTPSTVSTLKRGPLGPHRRVPLGCTPMSSAGSQGLNTFNLTTYDQTALQSNSTDWHVSCNTWHLHAPTLPHAWHHPDFQVFHSNKCKVTIIYYGIYLPIKHY